MRSRARYVPSFLLLTAVLLTGCAAGGKPAASQQAAVMAPEAKAHLDEVLELMQQNSMNRLTINWDDFRSKVYAKAAGAKSIADTRPAILEALTLLGDRHSFYIPKAGTRIHWGGCTTVPGQTTPILRPEIPSTVGYVKVTDFNETSDEERAAFADRTQQEIKSEDRPGVTGWIVDLRGNTGGNMWPMITAVSPILGDGQLGYFRDPTGAKFAWELRDGVAYSGGHLLQPNAAPYHLQHEAQRVAVLTDAYTASAGEAVAIAFKGRPGTRSFGYQTCGLSTGNVGHQLSDGGTLVLAEVVMADRTGKEYGGPVVPDEVIDDPAKQVERAIEWLQGGS